MSQTNPKYDIDKSAADEIAFLKNQVEQLNHWNEALNNRIVAVCDHEGACRAQNRELWELNNKLFAENDELRSKLNIKP